MATIQNQKATGVGRNGEIALKGVWQFLKELNLESPHKPAITGL
jgi:hypothetical protein